MKFGLKVTLLAKSFLRSKGIHLFRHSAPRGFDAFTDLRRSGVLCRIGSYIDVGANDGDYAAAAMSAMQNLESVILIEPGKENYKKLVSRFGGQAQIFRCAVSNYSGRGLLKISPSDKMHSLLPKHCEPESSSGPMDAVEVRTLSEVVLGASAVPPYFIKTDTEGNDIAVIEGMDGIVGDTICVFAEGAFSDHDSITPFQKVHDALVERGFLFWGIYDQSPWGSRGSCNFVNGLFINGSFLG